MAPRTLILGAGEGRRLGGPKALLLIDGTPLARWHAREGAVIVLRAAVAALLGPATLAPARVVYSDEPDELGPAGSIRAAVRSGAIDDGHWLVTPVDVPPADHAGLADLVRFAPLVAALVDHDAARHRRGHPIAIRGGVLGARYAVDPPPTLRDVLATVRCAVLPGDALRDLDTPEDVVALTGAPPAFFTRS